jgi:putative flippase GtrA
LVRLVKFNFTNGTVSVVGNVVFMRWLVGDLGLPLVVANVLAIAACGVINFVVSDRVVFRRCEG